MNFNAKFQTLMRFDLLLKFFVSNRSIFHTPRKAINKIAEEIQILGYSKVLNKRVDQIHKHVD